MTHSRRVPAILITLLVLAAGCAPDLGEVVSGVDPSPVASSEPTVDPTVTADGGWVGGEPLWHGGASGEASSAMESAAEGAREDAGADLATADSADHDLVGPAEAAVSRPAAEAPSSAAPPPDADEIAPQQAGPLRAGSVDDNADFGGFLAYLDRIAGLGITTRPYDPTGRVLINVAGASGLPVHGAEVVIGAGGSDVARLRTTADGSVRFHPALHGAAQTTAFDVTVGGVSTTAAPGETVDLTVGDPGGAQGAVPVDVLFLLDATGSMGDEIGQLKTSIDSIAARLDGLESNPDLRYGMTLYRDQGDAFVTATFDFTSDVNAFRGALANVVADGGGDTPEALDEALADALSEPTWRDPSSTVQLIFLVADAPPQVTRQVPQPYTASLLDAAARGIKVFPVASSDTDDQAEAVFRQLAQGTGGRFVFLSYGAGGAATGPGTDIDRTDYEELSLDDLVVRLVAEELAALTGSAPPPVAVSTPTNPPGQ